MKNFSRFLLLSLFAYILLYAGFSFAANVDSTNKWAWGSNIGWINFNPTLGDVTVTNTAVTGNAWSGTQGWIHLNPMNGGVTNTVEGLNGSGTCLGNLSGYAWNTNMGWIDFDGVSIDVNGYFRGTASGALSGTVSMSGSTHVVQTEWKPDCIAPTISIIGPSDLTIFIGGTYTEESATCSDNDSCNVTLSGSVDTSTAGTYFITYTSTDPTGNTSTVTRKVTVAVYQGGGGSGGGGGSSSGSPTTSPEAGGETSGENETDENTSGNETDETDEDTESTQEEDTSEETDSSESGEENEEETEEETEEEQVEEEQAEEETQEEDTEDTSTTESITKNKIINNKEVSYTIENSYDSCPIITDINDPEYPYPRSGVFADEESSSYKDLILKFAEIGVVNGTQEGNFEPIREITRSEFIKVVLISHCYKYKDMDPSDLSYVDIDKNSWQAKVVKKAQILGIINGDSMEDGTPIFRPNDIITKAEATKILLRMAMVQTSTPDALGYEDITVDWHVPYVRTGQTLGLFSPENTEFVFSPDGGVSREEMIVLIAELVSLYR